MARADRMSKTSTVKAYIGPTLQGIIQGGTVFSGGIPPKAAAVVAAYPFMAGLFVNVDNLAEARKELKRAGSERNMLYRRAKELGGNQNV